MGDKKRTVSEIQFSFGEGVGDLSSPGGCYCAGCLQDFGDSVEYSVIGVDSVECGNRDFTCQDHKDNEEWILVDSDEPLTPEEAARLLREGTRVKLQRCFPTIGEEDNRSLLSAETVDKQGVTVMVPFQIVEA